MPYVKLPTRTGSVGNHSMEGGVIVPWTTVLPGGINARAMAELDFLRNAADNGYDTFWYASVALNRQLTKAIGLYGEATLGKSSGGASADGRMGWRDHACLGRCLVGLRRLQRPLQGCGRLAARAAVQLRILARLQIRTPASLAVGGALCPDSAG